MSNVFIVSAKRTAIGSFLGSFKNLSAAELGSKILMAILDESKLDSSLIDEVIMGNVLSAGAGQGPARQASLAAGISNEVPAYGINMICGSGMKSVLLAYNSIKSGLSNCVIAGGMESMSNAPHLISANIRNGYKMGDMSVKDHMIKDGLWDSFNDYHMGITAENIAEKYSISRESQDEFALKSQMKAIAAIDEGVFDKEIVPVEIKSRKETVIVDKDEYPNRSTNIEKMAKLRPAFKKDGSVTAASSSGINDGASAVLVVSEEFMKANKLTPIAEIVSVGQGGVDPSIMGMGPVPAIKKALELSKLNLSDIDYMELNEAFAAQSLGVVEELSKTHSISKKEILEKTNIRGGAIALGHPIGASGNRILVSLLHILKDKNAEYGLASLCIGGGMGTAIIVKKA